MNESAIRVRLFAVLRERAGWAERCVPLAADQPPLTPAALWRALRLEPSIVAADDALPATVRVAVNQAFVAPDRVLQAGDEVAFLPPISGG